MWIRPSSVSTAWRLARWHTRKHRRSCERVLPKGLAKHDVPGFRLARIATDLRVQGQGLGGQLLAAVARRCLRAAAEVDGVILIIDAKGECAAGWYAGYGAVPLKDKPLTLVMSLATFAADLKARGHL
jgi:GNAT superfamily N-acetyltransferase